MLTIKEYKDTKVELNKPEKVYKFLKQFKNADREHFIVVGLNSSNTPIYREIAHIGTLNTTIIHQREIFRRAIVKSCNSIIIAHNHPSGDTTPSKEDVTMTSKLREAGAILGIHVVDHVIIGKSFYSFEANNWL